MKTFYSRQFALSLSFSEQKLCGLFKTFDNRINIHELQGIYVRRNDTITDIAFFIEWTSSTGRLKFSTAFSGVMDALNLPSTLKLDWLTYSEDDADLFTCGSGSLTMYENRENAGTELATEEQPFPNAVFKVNAANN
ncbi:hypothetical protein [Chryseolinea lacunae]|uniref:Uncharacterized protein n=1 Tax=Chryseolinea lacunae TaxID=2801331 RepID=A0ABS1KNN1_9BACT|nr:hypothetical protein [Chryseolinea lacunae]MBL0741054.1 hypothetical protein [Chryseolinea lacunae]